MWNILSGNKILFNKEKDRVMDLHYKNLCLIKLKKNKSNIILKNNFISKKNSYINKRIDFDNQNNYNKLIEKTVNIKKNKGKLHPRNILKFRWTYPKKQNIQEKEEKRKQKIRDKKTKKYLLNLKSEYKAKEYLKQYDVFKKLSKNMANNGKMHFGGDLSKTSYHYKLYNKSLKKKKINLNKFKK